jgi:hypothetical protein
MATRARATHATLYDFRDTDIMLRLSEMTNGVGVTSQDLADALGFEAEGEGTRAVGIRLAWMKRYGMVAYDDRDHTWKLSRGGTRVADAHLKAPELRVVEHMPDEKMVEVMALVTSRFQRGETMLGHMLRREFMYGTHRRRV